MPVGCVHWIWPCKVRFKPIYRYRAVFCVKASKLLCIHIYDLYTANPSPAQVYMGTTYKFSGLI